MGSVTGVGSACLIRRVSGFVAERSPTGKNERLIVAQVGWHSFHPQTSWLLRLSKIVSITKSTARQAPTEQLTDVMTSSSLYVHDVTVSFMKHIFASSLQPHTKLERMSWPWFESNGIQNAPRAHTPEWFSSRTLRTASAPARTIPKLSPDADSVTRGPTAEPLHSMRMERPVAVGISKVADADVPADEGEYVTWRSVTSATLRPSQRRRVPRSINLKVVA